MRRVFEYCSRTGKVRYRDWTGALIALATVQTLPTPRPEKRAYRCPHCSGYHLSSQELHDSA